MLGFHSLEGVAFLPIHDTEYCMTFLSLHGQHSPSGQNLCLLKLITSVAVTISGIIRDHSCCCCQELPGVYPARSAYPAALLAASQCEKRRKKCGTRDIGKNIGNPSLTWIKNTSHT
jgi:hypothetical protein